MGCSGPAFLTPEAASTSRMTDDDPEIAEVKELGQIERRQMGLARAHRILIVAGVAIILAVIFIVISRV